MPRHMSASFVLESTGDPNQDLLLKSQLRAIYDLLERVYLGRELEQIFVNTVLKRANIRKRLVDPRSHLTVHTVIHLRAEPIDSIEKLWDLIINHLRFKPFRSLIDSKKVTSPLLLDLAEIFFCFNYCPQSQTVSMHELNDAACSMPNNMFVLIGRKPSENNPNPTLVISRRTDNNGIAIWEVLLTSDSYHYCLPVLRYLRAPVLYPSVAAGAFSRRLCIPGPQPAPHSEQGKNKNCRISAFAARGPTSRTSPTYLQIVFSILALVDNICMRLLTLSGLESIEAVEILFKQLEAKVRVISDIRFDNEDPQPIVNAFESLVTFLRTDLLSRLYPLDPPAYVETVNQGCELGQQYGSLRLIQCSIKLAGKREPKMEKRKNEALETLEKLKISIVASRTASSSLHFEKLWNDSLEETFCQDLVIPLQSMAVESLSLRGHIQSACH